MTILNHACSKCGNIDQIEVQRRAPNGSGAQYFANRKRLSKKGFALLVRILNKFGDKPWDKDKVYMANRDLVSIGSIEGRISEYLQAGLATRKEIPHSTKNNGEPFNSDLVEYRLNLPRVNEVLSSGGRLKQIDNPQPMAEIDILGLMFPLA